MSPTLYFAATNPCHVYDLTLELHARGRLGAFYCGYPRWRLKPPPGFPHRRIGWRTPVVYAWRRLPAWSRPHEFRLNRWQDLGFDRAVARRLPEAGVLHGIPGMCRETFREARRRGLVTVLNHASGPAEQQARLIEPEYRRAGVGFSRSALYPPDWMRRLEEETALADYHCVASSVVRDQLIADGISADRIFVVPYGARPELFPKRREGPPARPRVLFAGQLNLRKGVHYLLAALAEVGTSDWRLDCYGPRNAETDADFERYRGAAAVRRHGPVPQAMLASEMAGATVLVLPSAEEAFGLVVAQALQVGLPCIVSDRVGAKDLIREGENGSVVPFGAVEPLAAALRYWAEHARTVPETCDWSGPAETMLAATERLAAR